MKKLTITLTCLSFFLLLNTANANFTDVTIDNQNYDAITYLNEKGIINGYDDSSFKPDNPINRAESAKIAGLAFNIPQSPNAIAIFSDVQSDDWFFPYVMGVQQKGIVNGYDDSTFKPTDTVNIVELLKIMTLSSNVILPSVGNENIFQDVKPDAWFAPYALYARENNIISIAQDENLMPHKKLTRGEFSEIVYRMMYIKEHDNKPFTQSSDWETFSSETIPFKIKYSPNWIVKDEPTMATLILPDPEFPTQSATRIYPNSASIQIKLDNNEKNLNSTQYFAGIKSVFQSLTQIESNISGLTSLEIIDTKNRTHDYYIYLSNSDVLILYSEYGNGTNQATIKNELNDMLRTFQYSSLADNTVDYSDVLSNIYQHLLVENKGMEMLNLLPEKSIIETDTIGVGTGPVDYYYCKSVNITFKYERNSDLILDKREGSTSAF